MAAFRCALVLVCTYAVAACTPTFNWREVPIADEGLVALLPCKADRATRSLPLGNESVTIDMAGCEAGGATFALAHMALPDAAQADAALRAWRASTRSQAAQQQDAGRGRMSIVEAPATLPRAAASPAPVRLDATPDASTGGESASGASSVESHMLWFAVQQGAAVSLYQATVLGKPSSAEALTTFFEGIRPP